jgi:hypothetical protein
MVKYQKSKIFPRRYQIFRRRQATLDFAPSQDTVPVPKCPISGWNLAKLTAATMVYCLFTMVAASWFSTDAWAVLRQTREDLDVLRDDLEYRLSKDNRIKGNMLPMLVAPPLHYWQESREGFAEAVRQMLQEIFNDSNAILDCQECDTWRLNLETKQKIHISNGELSLADLKRLAKDPQRSGVKTLALIKETPQGVAMRIIEIEDGAILFSALADATMTLDNIKPYHNLAQEKERRLREESLSYVFANLGVWPQGTFQLEYVEQWGRRNQHISGIALSIFNPNVALGGVYHYMFPANRRFHASGSIFLPLENVVTSVVEENDAVLSNFVGQLMIQATFANSYGIFLMGSSEGVVSLGINMYNPLFLPFIL